MTQEEVCSRLEDALHARLDEVATADDDDSSSLTSERSSAVKEMILRFERGFTASGTAPDLESDDDDDDGEYGDRRKHSVVASPGAVNAIHAQLAQLFPESAPDRTSSVSVNSILSGISEASFGSESSGIDSERKSGSDFGGKFLTHRSAPYRPAPLPPEPFDDSGSCASRSPLPDEDVDAPETNGFAFHQPCVSPVVLRRARQPPVMRRKSLAESHKELGVHWSYGVKQSDLEKLLKVRRRMSDGESGESKEKMDSSGSEEDAPETGKDRDEIEDVGSNDRVSTNTLIDEDEEEEAAEDSDRGDSSIPSDYRSNADNLSIRSISSFDMVPHQKYDSITVSSDEFGAEVCHAPDDEFLSVSAVNEWCVAKSDQPGLIPTENKREKYRRRLTERVNEFLHTEALYVDKLRHVVADYIPELTRRLTERVNELLHTEALYVDKLRHVVDDYIPELARLDAPAAVRGLRFDIFANIDKIHRFHAEELLPALRGCENDLKKLGQCFRSFEQKFYMYVIYSRNNKRSNRLVYEHKTFFQEKQLELNERLDLSSYLLEPVQRIPRYKLFLDDLVKTYQNYTLECGETDSRLSADSGGSGSGSGDGDGETTLGSLQRAKAMLESLLTTVDDIIALENIRDCPINLLSQGKLLRQHEFVATDPARRRHPMRVFLFEKVVLLTVVYKKQLTVEIFLYRDHIPVDDLGITPKEHDLHKFSIWYKKRNLKAYKLETPERAVRAAWVEEITALLWKQAMLKKEIQLRNRSARNSTVSIASQQSSDGDAEPATSGDKYNSLRGVPGEVRRSKEKKRTNRRTTWYYE